MAHLAIVGSHSTNGVAAIHSELLKRTVVPDFAALFPGRFNNKTNGVTQRRFLLLANPPLATVITDAIGDGWIVDLDQLQKLEPLAGDKAFRAAIRRAKREAKVRFAGWLKSATGQVVDPEAIFDTHIKRIHEYKRQLLNALHIVVLYNRLRENPTRDVPPRTFFFSGKAAPAYHFAKLIIKFINNLGATIDGDPAMKGRLKVVFVPDYSVSIAERLIPASDVSEQISTAGYEASGTGNMKLMMNGALTIGTRDGATIEMAAAAGEENFFLFGLSGRRGRQQPRHVQPAVALRQRARDARRARPHRRQPLQSERARCVRADPRRPASQGRPLPAPRRPQQLQRGARAAGRAVRGPGEVVAQSGPQHRGVQDILERPDHRGGRQGHLARRTVPGGMKRTRARERAS